MELLGNSVGYNVSCTPPFRSCFEFYPSVRGRKRTRCSVGGKKKSFSVPFIFTSNCFTVLSWLKRFSLEMQALSNVIILSPQSTRWLWASLRPRVSTSQALGPLPGGPSPLHWRQTLPPSLSSRFARTSVLPQDSDLSHLKTEAPNFALWITLC